MRKTILVALIFIVSINYNNAQEKTFYSADFGAGLGLNYGGVGISLAFAPISFLSIGGHLGYNFFSPTYGGEINLHIVPKNNNRIYGLALKSMYGYNTVHIVQGGNMDNKAFYGFNFGLSNELRFGWSKRNGINIDIIFPIRSDEAIAYTDELRDNGYETSSLTPVTISIGYHREF